jgi:hypothetical protein
MAQRPRGKLLKAKRIGCGAWKQVLVRRNGSVTRGTEVSGRVGDSEDVCCVRARDVVYSAIVRDSEKV